MADVLVAIPTFRRPNGLRRLLDALAGLDTDARVEVLVADNDAEGLEGRAVCDTLTVLGYRWPLTCIVVPDRGIAQARNGLVGHLVAHSTAPFVAMLDDDEWPAPHWLEAFMAAQRATGADALHGAVLRAFDTEPGAWADGCKGMASLRGRTGPTDMIHSTSNIFLRRECLLDLDRPWFDPAFGLTGGEDKEFFTRLGKAGARFAWADDATIYAHVPASRSTLVWALKRAYRVGNSDMRVFLKHNRSTGAMLRESAKIAGAAIFSPMGLVLPAAAPRERAADLCRMWRAAGKVAAICGARYNEYATIHGN